MYTLRFPFSLPPGQEIALTERSGELGSLGFSFKRQDRFYVFTFNGFPTEESAKGFIRKAWAGLMWLLLHRGLAPDVIFEPSGIVYSEDPLQAARNLGFKDPVDGLKTFGAEVPARQGRPLVGSAF